MTTAATSQNKPSSNRIQAVDLLRGAVMVLMAIDHVRVYSGMPAGGPDPGIFFTRWVTHFCVPAFVFLAGSSAFLYGNKLNDRHKLTRFLLTRGLLLVVLELTLIRFCWTFNLNYGQFMLAGVIWMLGWCMVLMALFVRLRPVTMGIAGLLVMFGQQLFHFVPLLLPQNWRGHFGWFWEFVYPSDGDWLPGINILYVIVPWIGVMMAGYGFGTILLKQNEDRKKTCLRIGISAIIVFLVASILVNYFGPAYNGDKPFLFRILDQKKYPASQLYLLMTLGPLIALVPFANQIKGRVADIFITFGRVPFFYYLLHIPLIHLLALGVNYVRERNIHQDWYGTAPYTEIAPEHRWGLPILYSVFIIAEVILYLACRYYAKYKAAHPEKKILTYI
ncbi:heparan-alpha-glucosaminide N-acetyltransferase domain-containing protein [Mucilaginibacter sp.]|uniref:DUF1624 domain-containing protein n=1 Tax=Mucilaginibacter sp. TaxID=1882438 RepID=UPI0025F3C814|nr:heparan-alpha-glucosaminide N-acetyltransferase domain-containing protein [Mucilaginibacter sp.]